MCQVFELAGGAEFADVFFGGFGCDVKTLGECASRFYARLSLKDAPGSLASATGSFAKHGVSISAAVQRGAAADGFARVIVLTHAAKRADMDAALAEIAASPVSGAAPVCLGIEG